MNYSNAHLEQVQLIIKTKRTICSLVIYS
jgi:hypothetical protein